MPIDFPNSPTNGDTYSAGGKNWVYNGSAWTLQGVVPSIPDGSVVEAKIGTGAVTADKIGSLAVTAGKIASNAVTAGKIAANAVSQAKLDSAISAITICTSSTKPASPFDGQVIYMTDVDQNAVWDGSSWVGLERSRDRNLLINGAMQISQRGTTASSISTIGFFSADRWAGGSSSAGTWTNAVVADAPTGTGFVNSNKWTCTTAQASLGSSAYAIVYQSIEGQNSQSLCYGTSSAKTSTLTFWVKSNVTGTYVVELWAINNKACAASYTISSAGVWEKKVLTFVGDVSNTLPNTNGFGIGVQFLLASGTAFTSGGTLGTTWNSTQNTRFVGQTNVASAINNYWQFTGVQFEVGAVATPFEFEDYGTTLAKCQRYFATKTSFDNMGGATISSTNLIARFTFPSTMRTAPNASVTSGSWVAGNDFSANYTASTVSVVASNLNQDAGRVQLGGFTGLPTAGTQLAGSDANGTATLQFSAEL